MTFRPHYAGTKSDAISEEISPECVSTLMQFRHKTGRRSDKIASDPPHRAGNFPDKFAFDIVPIIALAY